MELALREHVALVTGGASGIGLAIAEGFAAEGADVALWDVHPSVAEVAAGMARRFSVRALGLVVEITDQRSVEHGVNETAAQLGPIDHLVHSAAIGSGKFGFPFTNLHPDDWRKTLDVNVMGMVRVAHAIAPVMVARKSGTMIFIASVAGQMGSQTDPPYSASKAANINFAQCLAKDLAPHGVRVNSVCPGMVQTPLNRGVWQAWNDQQPADKKRSYEEWAGEKIRHVVPLGRWQEPRDVADMVVFLSSARAAQVTGQTINVDGGFVMHW
jgi:2-hydroxycyclohexanecarboxyl-CoA dehydrogenase